MRTFLSVAFCLPAVMSGATEVSFFRDVRPVLQRTCQGCHQPAVKSSGLDLTSFEGLQKGGRRGSSFIAGKPSDSLLVKYMKGDLKPVMPMGQTPLTPEQISLFESWITAGAKNDTPPELADPISADHPPVYQQAPVVAALAYSPDGQTLAISGYREVFLYKADGTGLIKRLVGQSERTNSLVFSPDGTLLIAAGGTPASFGEVQFWDVAAGKLKRSITLTNDTLFGLSISPDGREVAVGAADNSVRLIDVSTGKELQKIGNHENWVLGTVFGVNSARLVSVGRDQAAKLSNAKEGAFLENVNLLRGELAAVARHPRKDIVVIGGEERVPYIYLMDRPKVMKIADDTTLVRKLPRQDGYIASLAWSPEGSLIAVGGMGSQVNVYNSETGALVAACKGHAAGIYATAFHPTGNRLATGGFDGHVRIYNPATGEMLQDFVPAPISSKAASAEALSSRPQGLP